MHQDSDIDVEFDFFETHDPTIIDVLSSVFGKAKIINKKREKWEKGSFVFHLDEVIGVGNIFEIEIVGEFDINGYEKLLDECICKFESCSLIKIHGSNEDIVQENN